MIKQASKNIGRERPPINRLTKGMVLGKSAPKLKVKASESRGLLKCFRFALEHLIELETDHQKLRFGCVRELCTMYEIMDTVPYDGLRAASSARKAMAMYAELQQEDMESLRFQTRGFLLYKCYPKMHALIHCTETNAYSNPSLFWCYADESEIGAVVRVAASVHPSRIHRSVIRRNRVM